MNLHGMSQQFYHSAIIGLLISISLLGCTVGPDFHSSIAPNTKTYIQAQHNKTVDAQGQTQYFDAAQAIPAQWWVLFHSPAINQLIQQGLANSPNLAAAQAALGQAQENFNAEVGRALFPTINAGFSANRQRTFTGIASSSLPPTGLYNLYNASVNVAYSLDLFGKARRELESLRAQVDYQRFQVKAAHLTLAANIVTAAISEASLREQIQITHWLIHLQEKSLQVINKQFQLGGESQATLWAQQTQLAQVRATLPGLEKNLAQLRDGLAVLVGVAPTNAQLPPIYFSDLRLPLHLPLSCPSQLVRQRPDVAASEALLHSACAQIGVATANLFPQFNLTGNYGSISTMSNALLKANSNVWGLGTQALQPIFNAGALRAKRRGAVAVYDQAAAEYRQTVLQAFQNVADVLHALHFDTQTLEAERQAETAAKATWQITKQQYKLGAIDYLLLLHAERQYQQAHIIRIQAQAARYADTAALFQALGGGWWNLNKIK